MERWLWGWIAAPILGLVGLLFPLFIVLVPGESGQWGPKAIVHIGLVGVAIAVALGAGIFRLVVMVRRRQLGKWDVWFLAAALTFSALVGAIVSSEGDPFEIFAIGTLVMTGSGLLALIVAAIAGRDVDNVGVLPSIYLFGVAGIYTLLGLFFSAGYSGAFS